MKNRLIALIDFSIYSHALAELAARWSKISDTQLVFVHQVIGLMPALADDKSKEEIAAAEKERALEKLKKFIDEKGLTAAQHIVTESHLVNVVNDLSEDGYNDTVLVGIRGTGMLKRLLIGTTATRIIDELDKTVVAVPDKLCAEPNEFCNLLPKRLVISISQRFPLNEQALERFFTQYERMITKIEFVSTVDDYEDEERTNAYLKDLVTRYSSKYKTSYEVFRGKNHFEQIKEYTRREADTILIVQKGSRNFADLLFRKFLINEVVHDGSLPLVVLPNGHI